MGLFANEVFRYKMTDGEFSTLSAFVYEELGIKMPYPKKIMLQCRLQKRLAELNLRSFSEYLEFVFNEQDNGDEMIKMIDLVTTNKTDFFREPSHFDFLVEAVLPEIQSEGQKHIKLWSAGCSSGEEPYTIAILLNEFIRENPKLSFEILGTDISVRILQKAIKAIYHNDRIEQIPYDLKKKYFLKSKDKNEKNVRLVQEIRSKVTFQRLNFMDSSYAVDNYFDIVFCRNVLIYFDHKTQEQVINKLAAKIRKNGYLFLGHSESITNMSLPLKQVRPTIYRKIE
jgi:chemotaxis protein methyltransferase CheR